MLKRKIIIANWKMNPISSREALNIFYSILKLVNKYKVLKTDIVICPPFVYIPALLDNLSRFKKKSKLFFLVLLGTQDVSEENPPLGVGAYTGEISAGILKEIGVKYCLVGHSEKRTKGETEESISKKIKITLEKGITPILCVGENERDINHEYFNQIKNQIEKGLEKTPKKDIYKVIIAYEPVWAISTTKNKKPATPSDFKEMHIYIKKVLVNKYGMKIKLPRVVYGGSVNSKNAKSFLEEGGADGLLVGRESLKANNFFEIVRGAEKL